MDDDTREFLSLLFTEYMPFSRFLGIEIGQLESGTVRLELPFKYELVGNPELPALHGGVISALLDTCGGLTVWSQLDHDDRVSTVDLRIDYLRPGRAERLIAVGHVVRLGNRVGVAELRAYHPGAEDAPVAAGMGVYNIRKAGSKKGLGRGGASSP